MHAGLSDGNRAYGFMLTKRVGVLLSAAHEAGLLPVTAALLSCQDEMCMVLLFSAAHAAESLTLLLELKALT